MKNNLYQHSQKGAISIVAIVILFLLIGAGGYFVTRSTPKRQAEKTEQAIADIGVSVPDMDFSSSPLPDLKVSSFNVDVPQFPTASVFSAPTIDANFSYAPENLDISVPSASAGFEMPAMPANIPALPKGVRMPPGIPSGGAPSAPGAGGGAPQIDCSVFAAPPSCSFVGAPGSPGYEACKKCYPNK